MMNWVNQIYQRIQHKIGKKPMEFDVLGMKATYSQTGQIFTLKYSNTHTFYPDGIIEGTTNIPKYDLSIYD